MSRLRYVKGTGALGCVVMLLFVGRAEATRYYVDATATGNGTGVSWEHAFTDLQSALDEGPGNEVWVAAGTYTPSVGSGRQKTFAVNALKLYGGFAGGETALSERDPEVNETILSGDLGTLNDPDDDAYHVVSVVDEADGGMTISGFTITKGNANGAGEPNNVGGGLMIIGGDAVMHVTRCRFVDNLGDRGAGAYVGRVDGGMVRLVNCEFFNNNTYDEDLGGGGGFWIHDANYVEIINCVSHGNTAAFGSGGLIGGIGEHALTDAAVVNCTFYGNTALTFGSPAGGLQIDLLIEEDQFAYVTNSVSWGNSDLQVVFNGSGAAEVHYSDVEGGWGGTGSNNINSDPDFCDPSNGDFRLDVGSACVDAGNDGDVPADAADIDDDGNTGENLPWDLIKQDRDAALSAHVDMGAIENPHDQDCPYSLDGDNDVDLTDLSILLGLYGSTGCFGDDCLGDLNCNRDVDIGDLALVLSAFGQTCGFSPVDGDLAVSIAPYDTSNYSGGGFEGEDEHFVFDALIELDEEDDDWTTSGTVITGANGATFRLAPIDGVPTPGSSEPDKYATFFSVPKGVNANGRFNDPMGGDGDIAGACHPPSPDYTFTTTAITACWYDIDNDSNDGPAAVLRLVIDVSGVAGADTSGGLGSVYFSTSGPTSGGDIKVADFGLATAHAAEGGELTTVMGEFYVTD